MQTQTRTIAGTYELDAVHSRIGFEGQAAVHRKAWGVSRNEALDAGGVLVGDKVTLEFDVSAIHTAD